MAPATEFRIGTASWTDPTLIESSTFYPPAVRTAEQRLRFYASKFDTVEVDSSYYALPAERNARLWVERTPPDFILNVKAFAMFTRHAADTKRLPPVLRAMLTAEQRSRPRLEHPGPEIFELAMQMFLGAIGPLHQAGKLGMVLFQFPPYFTCRPENFDYIAEMGERFSPLKLAVEFRHPSWVLGDGRRRETMKFLSHHGLAYVSVDEPQTASTMPSFLEVTGPEAYLRFHGRNREAWFKRNLNTAERYKYLYAEDELAPWAKQLRELSGVRRAFVIFNNCYRNFGMMNATMMAAMLKGGRDRGS